VNIVLWKKRNDFELGTNFGAWARSVAHYKIMEHREKKAKHEGLLVFSEDLCRQLASDSQDRGAGELESKRHALAFCLTKLSPENRELLKTRYASSNGGIDRVSAETGRSPASIRVTLFRLRAGLRKCIHSYLVMKGGSL
jgi:RNA polymerase sigma-70 factor (ECF subfamily)